VYIYETHPIAQDTYSTRNWNRDSVVAGYLKAGIVTTPSKTTFSVRFKSLFQSMFCRV
jgi:hypothetical protein